MALPWLPSLSAFADTNTPAAFPKRFAVLFMGNGINLKTAVGHSSSA
jgi:hypothetical protein